MQRNEIIVLDASVAIKWFHDEPDTEKAFQLEARIARGEIQALVPPLLFYEVANALATKPGSVAEEVIGAHRILQNLPLQITEILHAILEDAIRLAHQHRVSIYDAVYVALALVSGAPLLTADEKLAETIGAPTIRLLSEI